MKIPGFPFLIALAAFPLAAASIDVTTQTVALLHTGDTLFFTVSTYGFVGLPTNVSFNFVSNALTAGSALQATLQSRDGSVTADFSQPYTFTAGQFQGSYYQGAVASLYGSMSLSGTLSQSLFAGSAAFLELRNLGPDVTLGLPPYTLAEDLTLSLSAGGTSRGGVSVRVQMDAVAVPEPDSRLAMFAGAILLLAVRSSGARVLHCNARDCKPPRLSDTI